MADSSITKKALANAMKELMEQKKFSKINVGEICSLCNMNRKSFYYHFKDKYDLVNWIFYSEFVRNNISSKYCWIMRTPLSLQSSLTDAFILSIRKVASVPAEATSNY